MLTAANRKPARCAPRQREQGIVLMMALIVLVAMTLAGIALVRSVDTTNVIAGNLAFQQAATNSADTGTETAAIWLQNNNSGNTLHSNIYAQGYAASLQPAPSVGQSWDAYWRAVLVPAGQVVTLPADSAGNTVAYTIQRLCNATGDPLSNTTGCAITQSNSASNTSSKTAGTVALLYTSQIYYRITTRVAGPRNTVSYIQTIVAL